MAWCRYTVIFVFPILYLGWKIIKKTKLKSSLEVDLYHDFEEIEEYTKTLFRSRISKSLSSV